MPIVECHDIITLPQSGSIIDLDSGSRMHEHKSGLQEQ